MIKHSTFLLFVLHVLLLFTSPPSVDCRCLTHTGENQTHHLTQSGAIFYRCLPSSVHRQVDPFNSLKLDFYL